MKLTVEVKLERDDGEHPGHYQVEFSDPRPIEDEDTRTLMIAGIVTRVLAEIGEGLVHLIIHEHQDEPKPGEHGLSNWRWN